MRSFSVCLGLLSGCTSAFFVGIDDECPSCEAPTEQQAVAPALRSIPTVDDIYLGVSLFQVPRAGDAPCEAGRLVYANATSRSLLGAQRTQIGLTFAQLQPEMMDSENGQLYCDLMEDALREQVVMRPGLTRYNPPGAQPGIYYSEIVPTDVNHLALIFHRLAKDTVKGEDIPRMGVDTDQWMDAQLDAVSTVINEVSSLNSTPETTQMSAVAEN